MLVKRMSRVPRAWARGEAHINGIEGFRGYAKSRLAKFRGMRNAFYLHLKEFMRRTTAQPVMT